MGKTPVTFLPGNTTIQVPAGCTVLDAAREAGLFPNAQCGGRGQCGKCRVMVRNYGNDITTRERQALGPAELHAGWRLACQVAVSDIPLVVEVPQQKHPHMVKAGLTGSIKPSSSPLLHKVSVPSPVAAGSGRGSWEYLQESLAAEGFHVGAGLDVMRSLPDVLQKGATKVTAVIYGDQVVAVEAGDTVGQQYGLALDIGTTTVAGSIVDLCTGREIAAAAPNRQNRYGADILSRIDFAVASPAGLRELTDLVRDVVNDIISDLTRRARIESNLVCAAAVVGNTCMLHLFAGINPGSLAVPPFAGTVHQSFEARAGQLGIDIAPAAPVLFLPVIAGYVGADTTGVLLATDLHESDRITLAVDIGTNGEIVLGSRDRLVACATAAGPALEGATIRAGMPAAEGAIDRVMFAGDDVTCSVIGGGEPKGICGSGLVDAVAVMLEAGLLDATGRLLEPREAAARVGSHLASRVRDTERDREFVLTGAVAITQRDIRQVQLAKAAIRAGISILQRELSVDDSDIEAVLLAGSFGSFLNKTSALRLGLLPSVPPDRVRHVGNAAHQGAKMVLLDQEVMLKARSITRRVEYVELSASADFSNEFVAAITFDPHPAGEN